MGTGKIGFYYKNVTAEVIGAEHGVTAEQLKGLGEETGPLIAKLNEQRKKGLTPYRELPYNQEYPAAVEKLAGEVKGCENFVVLGIGGSALGNIAVQTALNPYMYNIDSKQRKGARLFVLDNVDPAQLGSFLKWIEGRLDKTVFNVISKAGETPETASQFLTVRAMLEKKLGERGCRERIIATTDAKEGTMRKIADDAKYRTLVVPDGVGGRFSVLSPVGLLSAAVCGIDVDGLLAGARAMDKRVSTEDFYANPAAINAAINYHYYNRGKRISVMMPYAYGLKDMADWYRQLWAESLGKAKDLSGKDVHVGATPVKALGTTDQHSQVQLYREGPNDKLFTFLQVEKFAVDVEIGAGPECASELKYLWGEKMSRLIKCEKAATEYALLEANRPCLTVMFEEVDAEAVGEFIYLFEVTTSLAGLLFNINAYDQAGVELGKEATFALMGREGYEKMAEKIKTFAKMDEEFVV